MVQRCGRGCDDSFLSLSGSPSAGRHTGMGRHRQWVRVKRTGASCISGGCWHGVRAPGGAATRACPGSWRGHAQAWTTCPVLPQASPGQWVSEALPAKERRRGAGVLMRRLLSRGLLSDLATETHLAPCPACWCP